MCHSVKRVCGRVTEWKTFANHFPLNFMRGSRDGGGGVSEVEYYSGSAHVNVRARLQYAFERCCIVQNNISRSALTIKLYCKLKVWIKFCWIFLVIKTLTFKKKHIYEIALSKITLCYEVFSEQSNYYRTKVLNLTTYYFKNGIEWMTFFRT